MNISEWMQLHSAGLTLGILMTAIPVVLFIRWQLRLKRDHSVEVGVIRKHLKDKNGVTEVTDWYRKFKHHPEMLGCRSKIKLREVLASAVWRRITYVDGEFGRRIDEVSDSELIEELKLRASREIYELIKQLENIGYTLTKSESKRVSDITFDIQNVIPVKKAESVA